MTFDTASERDEWVARTDGGTPVVVIDGAAAAANDIDAESLATAQLVIDDLRDIGGELAHALESWVCDGCVTCRDGDNDDSRGRALLERARAKGLLR